MSFEEESIEKIMKQEKDKYRLTIPEKIKTLESLIEAIVTKPSEQNVKLLRESLHKIAGSSGIYGFNEVSQMCKQMEVKVLTWMDDLSKVNNEELQEFLKTFKKKFK